MGKDSYYNYLMKYSQYFLGSTLYNFTAGFYSLRSAACTSKQLDYTEQTMDSVMCQNKNKQFRVALFSSVITIPNSDEGYSIASRFC